ncbi:MAG: sulfatase [Myxococcota bacterium]
MPKLRPKIPVLGGLLLVALSLLLLELLGVLRPRERDPRDRPNLLVLSIDTLRADHLGSYGYDRDTSPGLDALAERSVRFANVWAPSPWTLPSHAGMLTGIHPKRLGIATRDSSLPERAVTLAEHLAGFGYRTAGFVDSMPGGFVGSGRGFARGFGEYRHLPAEATSGYRYDMAVTADRAIEWLDRADRGEPFFLFLHTKSVHALPSSGLSPDPRRFPYDKPEPYRSRFLTEEGAELSWVHPQLGSGIDLLRGLNEGIAAGRVRRDQIPDPRIEALKGLYDGGIVYVDHHFGRVLEALDRNGLASGTVVVVTSDHGESFLEHDLLLHKEVYPATLRVPLIVHLPWARSPGVVTERATLMDLVPTILAIAGAPVPPHLDGTALSLEGNVPVDSASPLFAYYHSTPGYYYEGYAMRDEAFTLVHHRLGRGSEYRTELYDHRTDPEELFPLRDQPTRSREMLLRLSAWRETGAASPAPTIEVDPETLDHLRALGYAD